MRITVTDRYYRTFTYQLTDRVPDGERIVWNKEKTMLNVRDFGAMGDGSTNDTDAIQRTMDAAVDAHETVYFPAGVYCCGTLHTRDHIGLLADPTWGYLRPAGAILQLVDDTAPCLLDLQYCRGLRLNGLCLQGNKRGQQIHGAWARDRKRDGEDFGLLAVLCG